MILSEALYRSETLWIEYYYTPERPNKRLAFAFSSLGSKILNQNINGGDYLIENGFDIVNFNSSRTDWFQSVPADVFAAIAKIDRAQNYQQRVAMGPRWGDTRRSPSPNLWDATWRWPIPRKRHHDPVRSAICRSHRKYRMGVPDFRRCDRRRMQILCRLRQQGFV
ncbi:MAG TPA: hypothetical protein VHR44_04250 [Beijerinckiaceae bacterium]|jgi:hypothetical protein|nr:hypothetical protein [Beijerinckiaceae bacterium]